MAKYMLLWEVDFSRVPEDPKAKKAQQLGFCDLIAKQLKEGVIKDWAAFAGEPRGYVIIEGSTVKIHTNAAMWAPFVKFKTMELMTIDEIRKSMKALPE